MIYKFKWKKNLFDYEKQFAEQELVRFIGFSDIKRYDEGLLVESDILIESNRLKMLTYFKEVEVGQKTIIPEIIQWEKSAFKNENTRQSTRYFSHGIHEYKGKFNPQVVHSILRQWNVSKKDSVYDPFAGSGTTLLESALAGVKSFGTDVNPLAVMISNAKQDSLRINPCDITCAWENIALKLKDKSDSVEDYTDERLTYLRKWFPKSTLELLEKIRQLILEEKREVQNILFVLISNVLREYSFQNPSDLRIRRRVAIPDQPDLTIRIEKDIQNYVSKLERFENLYIGEAVKATEIIADNKNYISKTKFSIAITSPPYANALPYIDTQRLSIVWLYLAKPSEIKFLDSNLIGSREAPKSELDDLRGKLLINDAQLPKELYLYLMMLQSSLSETDGFRRQATPSLLYKYFVEMKTMFSNVRKNLQKDAPYLLIVGRNKTTLGGKTFIINTPYWLGLLAKDIGWQLNSITELQSYARFEIHSQNSVNTEDLIELINI